MNENHVYAGMKVKVARSASSTWVIGMDKYLGSIGIVQNDVKKTSYGEVVFHISDCGPWWYGAADVEPVQELKPFSSEDFHSILGL